MRVNLGLGLGIGGGGSACRQVLNFKGSNYVDLPDISLVAGQTVTFSYALAGGIPTSNEYFIDGDNGTRPIFRINSSSQFQGYVGLEESQGSLDGVPLNTNWPNVPVPNDSDFHEIVVVAATGCVLSRVGIAGGNFGGFNGKIKDVKVDDGSQYFWKLNEGPGTTIAVNSGSVSANGTYVGISDSDWEEVCP